MPVVRDGIRIGLIGPTSAGKTSMFHTFQEALDRGRHGFPKSTDPQIQRTREATPVAGLSPEDILDRIIVGESDNSFDGDAETLRANVGATPADQIVSRHYSLSYVEHGQRISVPLTITDAAGEHSFGKNVRNKALEEYRRQLRRELGNCHGFVVVVPFSNATDQSFVRQLEQWLTGLDEIAEQQERSNPALASRPRRLVIALTRYDALFTDFGSEAIKLATDTAIVLGIIRRLVRVVANGVGYERNIARFDRSVGRGRFEIAFVPTSSFGFVPGFGCVNLDPDVSDEQALGAIASGSSPGPFTTSIPDYSGQHLFPFLTPDPFIFAATGLPNPFVIHINRALNGDQAPDALPPEIPRGDTPRQSFPDERRHAARNGGDRAPEKETVNNVSVRRTVARLIKKIDIRL